jgi:hypothetical protein
MELSFPVQETDGIGDLAMFEFWRRRTARARATLSLDCWSVNEAAQALITVTPA